MNATFVIIGLITIVGLASSGKDWRAMDVAYAYSGEFDGKCLEPTWVELWFKNGGRGHGEHSTFDICSNSEGFYFGTPPNIFGLKPIFVPWHDVSVHVEDRPAYQTVVLKFRLLPGYTFEFAKDDWDQLSVTIPALSH